MSYKYDKLGFRRDKNLSDAGSGKRALDNLLNDLALPGEFFIGEDIRVINGLAQTPVTNDDIANFRGTAPKASQNRWTLELEVKVPVESILFDPGLEISFNDFTLRVIVYSSPTPIDFDDLSQGYKFDLFLQADVAETGIVVGSIIDLTSQQVEVLNVVSNAKSIEEFTVQPLITIKDQKEFYELTTANPRSGKGGEGLKALFLPSSQIRFDSTPNGSTISSTLESSPQAYGPFDYWDSGVFAYSNRIYDSNAFRDGGGGILWEGYIATPDFWTGTDKIIQVTTNGQIVIEQWNDDTEEWVVQGRIRDNVSFTGRVAGPGIELIGATDDDLKSIALGSSIIVPSFDTSRLVGGDGELMQVTALDEEKKSISVTGGIEDVFPPSINEEGLSIPQVITFELVGDPSASEPRRTQISFTKTKHFNEKVKLRILSFFEPFTQTIDYGGFKYILFTDLSSGSSLSHTSLYNEYNELSPDEYNEESILYFYKNTLSAYNESLTSEGSLDVDGLFYVDYNAPVSRSNIVSRTDYVTSPNRRIPDELKENRDIKFSMVSSYIKPGAFRINMTYNDTDIKVGDYLTLIQSNKYGFIGSDGRGYKQKHYIEQRDEFQNVSWFSSGASRNQVNTDTVVSSFKIIHVEKGTEYVTLFVDENDIIQHNGNIDVSEKPEFTFPPYIETSSIAKQEYLYYDSFEEEENTSVNWISGYSNPVVFAIIYPGEGLLDIVTTASDDREDDVAVPRIFKSTLIENENVSGLLDSVEVGNLAMGLNFASDLRYVDRFSERPAIKQYVAQPEGGSIPSTNHGQSTWNVVAESLQTTSPSSVGDLTSLGGIKSAIVEVVNDNEVQVYTYDRWIHASYEDPEAPDLLYWACRNSKAEFKPSDFGTTYAQFLGAPSWNNAFPIKWLDVTPYAELNDNEEINVVKWSGYYQGFDRNYTQVVEGESVGLLRSTTLYNFASMIVSEISNPVYDDFGLLVEFDISFYSTIPWNSEPVIWEQSFVNDSIVYLIVPFLDGNGTNWRHMQMPPLSIVDSSQVSRRITVTYQDLTYARITQTEFDTLSNNDFSANRGEVFKVIDSRENVSELDKIRRTGYKYHNQIEAWDTTEDVRYPDGTTETRALESDYFPYKQISDDAFKINTAETTGDVGELLVGFENFKNVTSNNNFLIDGSTGDDLDKSAAKIVAIYSDKGLLDMSSTNFCRGVESATIVQDAAVGATSLYVDDVTNIDTSKTAQFDGYIPEGTLVSSVDQFFKIVELSNPLTREIRAGFTIVFAPNNLQNYEVCAKTLDTSAPFDSTENGLITSNGIEDLSITDLSFKSIELKDISVSAIDAQNVNTSLSLNYIDELGNISQFRLLGN